MSKSDITVTFTMEETQMILDSMNHMVDSVSNSALEPVRGNYVRRVAKAIEQKIGNQLDGGGPAHNEHVPDGSLLLVVKTEASTKDELDVATDAVLGTLTQIPNVLGPAVGSCYATNEIEVIYTPSVGSDDPRLRMTRDDAGERCLACGRDSASPATPEGQTVTDELAELHASLPDDYQFTELDLTTVQGNAGSIMAAVSDALRAAGNPNSVIDAWRIEAMSGDYNHLLRAAMIYTSMP